MTKIVDGYRDWVLWGPPEESVEIGEGEKVVLWPTKYLKDFYIGRKIDFVMAPEDRPRSRDQALNST